MAAPNIVNVTSIIAGTVGLTPTTTNPNVLLSNLIDSNSVIKVNSLVVTNVTDTVAATTVSINSSAAGVGTNTRIAYNIYVPANASLQLVDKGNFLYLVENRSIIVTSGVGSSLDYLVVFETIQ
jgi:hypothetical protein